MHTEHEGRHLQILEDLIEPQKEERLIAHSAFIKRNLIFVVMVIFLMPELQSYF